MLTILPNINTTQNTYNFGFKARFSQKDIKILMNSAKDEIQFTRNTVIKQSSKTSAKDIYGRLSVLLDHIDSIKGKSLGLIEEKLSNGKKFFKIVNDKNEIISLGQNPMMALDSAFVFRSSFNLAPEHWGNKIPNNVIHERQELLGEITEQEILAKAL